MLTSFPRAALAGCHGNQRSSSVLDSILLYVYQFIGSKPVRRVSSFKKYTVIRKLVLTQYFRSRITSDNISRVLHQQIYFCKKLLYATVLHKSL